MKQATNHIIPVSVITGFLGSGKTTLLNHLVKQPGMSDTAVIVNEFGEIGIDHLLIEQAIEDTVLLQNGCICCSIRGDLVDTLESLLDQVERGDIPSFSRAIIETTGLADPAPVLQTLMTNERLAGRFSLDAIVTTVDAVNGARQLVEFGESQKQAAVADHIFMTKTDLADDAAAFDLETKLRAINRRAPIIKIINGQADPDSLFGNSPLSTKSRNDALDKWLLDIDDPEPSDHGPGHDHEHRHSHGHGNGGIDSFTVRHDAPLPWDAVKSWLESVASLRGSDLLRVKGILNVEGRDGPVIIHGVQHIFHPPVELEKWPSDDHQTRIVFITRNIDLAALGNSLAAFVEDSITSSII